MPDSVAPTPVEVSSEKDEAICFFKRRNRMKSALVRHAALFTKTLIFLLGSVAPSGPIYLCCFAENGAPLPFRLPDGLR